MLEDYKKAWEQYYRTDSRDRPPSSILPTFISFLERQNLDFNRATVVEPFCGVGRNTITLAQHGINIIGVDLVDAAIEQATLNTGRLGVEAQFVVADLTREWDFVEPTTVEAIIDIDGTTSLPSFYRHQAIEQAVRALRPWGLYLFSSTSAPELVKMFPALDGMGYIHPRTGAYKMHYEQQAELINDFAGLKLIEMENIPGENDIIEGREIHYSRLTAYFQKQ